MTDTEYFDLVFSLAKTASHFGEVPVGAIIVDGNGDIIGSGFNLKEKKHDPCHHAEIQAIQSATRSIKNWRLIGCVLYCNLEPCIMCSGAIIHSRIKQVHFGLRDPKFGGLASLYEIGADPRLNHRINVLENGAAAQRSSRLLKEFFQERRRRIKS